MTRKIIKQRWRFVLDAEIGNRGIPTHCALAEDMKDTYPELINRPHITDRSIAFTDAVTDERLSWKPSISVRKWLDQFDKGGSPDPLAIILKRADAVTRTTDRKSVRRTRKTPEGVTHKSRGLHRRTPTV
jgi:hypothetical protein